MNKFTRLHPRRSVTPDGRIDPQPVTLSIVPSELAERDEEALAAANGVNLFERGVRRLMMAAAPVLLLAFVIACIVRGGR